MRSCQNNSLLFDVTAETACSVLADYADSALLKLASAVIEVNVLLPCHDVPAVIDTLRQPTGNVLCAGISAGSSAHWIHDEESTAYLLIGDGRETWDIGLTLSAADRCKIIVVLQNLTTGANAPNYG